MYGIYNKNDGAVYNASYTYKRHSSDSAGTSGVVDSITYGLISIENLEYLYDKNGNIIGVNDSDGNVLERYSYDDLNQLSYAFSAKDDYYIAYAYDNGGNIFSKKTYSASYYVNKKESLLKSTVNYTYDSTWKDKLISYNGKSISYDAIGNMLSFDSQTFSWLGRRLMSYAKGGTTTNYTYNSDGIRTKKVSGSTTTDYCLNGTQILAEKRGSTLINYLYASDGTRVGFKTGGKVYYYVYNLQGDVTHIVDESRNIAATYRYDPFGKILNLSSLTNIGKLNPFRYRGYYYDTESNLYYLNSRYYNPEIGRFINADGYVTTGAGLLSCNMFAYCLNNPVKYYDHSGTMTYGFYLGVGVTAIIGCSVEIGFCIDDNGDFAFVYDYSIPDKIENTTVGVFS
ncbi:MAG: RHS repeat-associated core domain-containing protein, partial [Oscillospiraceae bacterium]|nr:RHS repeat-associated core domain-containing protein [Oscillospiraceae bacterium]